MIKVKCPRCGADIPDVNVLFRRVQNNEQKVFR